MTLYESIVSCLSVHNHSIQEIKWVGNTNFTIPRDVFFDLSKQITDQYSSVYTNLAIDILVVGDTFWLECNEYADELESFENNIWIYRTQPQKPEIEKSVSGLSFEQLQKSLQDMIIEQYGIGGYSPPITLELLIK